MSTRLMLLILCLVVSTAFSGWYYVHRHHQTIAEQVAPNHYDYYAEGVDFILYDQSGHINRRYLSKDMQHFRRDNTTDFQNPVLTVHQEKNPPWIITAKHGQAKNNDEKITLWDHVRLQQKAGVNQPGTIILTERLYFLPKKHFASTDAKISYQQPGSHIVAHGMRAFFDEQRIQLLSDTRGRYVKPSTA